MATPKGFQRNLSSSTDYTASRPGNTTPVTFAAQAQGSMAQSPVNAEKKIINVYSAPSGENFARIPKANRAL